MRCLVIAECYADTLLTELITNNKVNHALGIGEVLNQVNKAFERRYYDLIVGIIDKDNTLPKDLTKFSKAISEDQFVKVIKHPNENCFIVLIKNDHEDLIVRDSKQINIKDKRFVKYKDKTNLELITKTKEVAKNTSYLKYLKILLENNCHGITSLKVNLHRIINPQ